MLLAFGDIVHNDFNEKFYGLMTYLTGCTAVFTDSTEEGRKRWEDLKSRVVEHNIRIMAKYYNRITLTRFVIP